MNILLSSVGRRSYLVKYFQDALGVDGIVVGTNCIPDTQGLLATDRSYVVPKANHPNYIDILLKICETNEVKLLFSLHDLDGYILSQNKDRFSEIGVTPVISDYSVMKTTLNKYKTYIWANENDVNFPNTFLKVEDAILCVEKSKISFPLIVKPIHGCGSIEIRVAHNEEELYMLGKLVNNQIMRSDIANFFNYEKECIVIQEYIKGQEFGLDIVNDLNGKYITCFVKRKFGMRAGETDGAIVEDNEELKGFGAHLGDHLNHIGLMDTDVFVTEEGKIYLLEMNPRFGGGYPFSHIAGADIPRYFIALAKRSIVDPSWLQVETGVRGYKDIDIVTISK